MQAPTIVESLEGEHRIPGGLARFKRSAVVEFALHAAEEALHGRIIPAIAFAAHGADHARLAQQLAVVLRGILLRLNWSSQHLSAPISTPHQEPPRAFSSRASCAACC